MIKHLNEIINEQSDVIDFARRVSGIKNQFEEERQLYTK